MACEPAAMFLPKPGNADTSKYIFVTARGHLYFQTYRLYNRKCATSLQKIIL